MKGMQKIKRGRGFRGALNYGLEREDGKDLGQIVGGNMAGHDPQTLTAEFAVSRRLRPEIEKPVWHNSLRLPEGENLSGGQWAKIGDEYMQRMGFKDDHQRVYVIHDDPEGQHIHLYASRISLIGELYLGRNENLKSTKIIAELEQKHGLKQTPGAGSGNKTRPKAGEVELALRTGEAPARLVLQQAIDQALADEPDTAAFLERLETAGITAQPNIASTGRMNGFSFEYQSVAFKASQLGKAYSWSHLQKRGLDYDQARDQGVLRAAQERSQQQQEDLAGPEGQPAQQYKRTIDYMQQVEPGAWRFESGKRIAVRELENGGMWCSRTDTAARAAVQLALNKGWSVIKITTDDPAHAARLYKAALKVGYPPHMLKLTKAQLTREQTAEIEKGAGYEQDRSGPGISDPAQQGDQSADPGATAATKPKHRAFGATDRAAGQVAGGAVGGQPGGDPADRSGVEQGPTPERRADHQSRSQRQQAVAGRDLESLDSSDQQQRADSADADLRIHDLAAPAQQQRTSSGQVLQRDQPGRTAKDFANRQGQQPVTNIKAKQQQIQEQEETRLHRDLAAWRPHPLVGKGPQALEEEARNRILGPNHGGAALRLANAQARAELRRDQLQTLKQQIQDHPANEPSLARRLLLTREQRREFARLKERAAEIEVQAREAGEIAREAKRAAEREEILEWRSAERIEREQDKIIKEIRENERRRQELQERLAPRQQHEKDDDEDRRTGRRPR